jgi:molybdopterin synthase catalytic subunit
MEVRVQADPFDPGDELSRFAVRRGDNGAAVTFTGIVRDDAENPLEAMEIEHYPGMTEASLREMAQTAVARFGLGDVLVIHRHGRLVPGEVIMMVATAAPHRRAAFDAADFLMDYLKSRAPFWKREIRGDGVSWVDAKAVDEDALKRW